MSHFSNHSWPSISAPPSSLDRATNLLAVSFSVMFAQLPLVVVDRYHYYYCYCYYCYDLQHAADEKMSERPLRLGPKVCGACSVVVGGGVLPLFFSMN